MDTNTLPAILQEIAGLIGEPDTLRLVQHYGGRDIRPVNMRGELERAIGLEASQKLAFHFGISTVYVPLCKALVISKRNQSIAERFDELTKYGHSARRAVAMLATEHRITERHVWRILKESGANE